MRSVITVGLLASVALHSSWADPRESTGEAEEILVMGEKDLRRFELAETVGVVPDSADILKKVVGANVVRNGPLTGMAQYRGMSRYRVSTQINGTTISSGGPNWMDPPLSYAPAAHLESIEIYRGIAPVRSGAETIGGAVAARTWQGNFSDDGAVFNGRVRSGAQSVHNAKMISTVFALSGSKHLIKLSALHEAGDDAEFTDGEILPTEYKRDRWDIGYGYRTGPHTFRFDYGRNATGNSGTPALPMDIGYIDAELLTLSWDYAGETLQVAAKLHGSDIKHGMTNYHLRQPPAAAAQWRQNIAEGENFGFSISARWQDWRFGLDGHDELHDSNIDNPNNPMFFVINFNNAQRRVLGAYLEREFSFGQGWLIELGARYNRVDLDADPVNATPAMMGMPAAVALRNNFNAADRDSQDHHLDWVIKFNYLARGELNLYAGFSRKSRSPSYQEKFLWLPLQATAGLADGRTYTGNLRLDAEVAHELELGFDWQSERFSIAPRIFYRDIEDYIQGTASTYAPALMFAQMMNTMNGSANPSPLQFSNVDASFYGFDIDWRYQLSEQWSLKGIVNYVRGARDDIDDALYRVAAPNLFVALSYTLEDWQFSLEGFAYDGQNHVSDINGETKTAGYGLINFQGAWKISEQLKLGFGIDNLADRYYVDHLAGVNRVNGNTDLQRGTRLPGYGRNFFARLDYNW